MNSLVVLLSVVAFASAKPSGLLAYSTPVLATGSAGFSSQSRLDIKSSPAVVTTSFEPIARTVIAEPTLLSAPSAIIGPSAVSSQSRIDIKSTPAITSSVISAPLAYSAPAVIKSGIVGPVAIAAPAAISSQSRVDIKSSPAITSSVISGPIAYSAPAVIAGPIAGPSAVSSQSRIDIKSTPAVTSTVISSAPIAYSGPTLVNSAIATPAFATTYGAAGIAATAYGTPSFAVSSFGAPTLIKTVSSSLSPVAISSGPWETPEVAAARAAHLEAKVLAGATHSIHKRSVAVTGGFLSSHIATPVVSTYAATAPVITTYAASPLAYSTPLALSTPLLTKAYSIHPW